MKNPEFKEFIDEIINELPDYLLEFKIEKMHIENVTKNNGVEYTGILVFVNGESMSPNIYMNFYYDAYKKGVPMELILKQIAIEYKNARKEMLSEKFMVPDGKNYAKNVFLRLINYEKNKEQLVDCPFIMFHDLAITIRYLAKKDEEGIASVIVTNRELKNWGISKEELYCIAKENTLRLFPPVIERVDKLLIELGCKEDVSPTDNMYILTNDVGVNGATSMIFEDTLKEFALEHSADIYIIPTSIHEVVLIPEKNNVIKEKLQDMLEDINKYVITSLEYLSDTIYKYDFKELCVKI